MAWKRACGAFCAGLVALALGVAAPEEQKLLLAQKLLTDLQSSEQAVSNRAAERLLELAKGDPEVRQFLVSRLPTLLQKDPPDLGGFQAWMWENGFRLVGKLKIEEGICTLVKHLLTRTTPEAGIGFSYYFGDRAAVGALIDMGAPAVPAMVQVLKDGKPPEREAAAYILGKIGTNAARATLRRALAKERDPKVRKRIERATEGLD